MMAAQQAQQQNKRKREAKLDNMIQGNPKLLLVSSGLFPPGTSQQQLPFFLLNSASNLPPGRAGSGFTAAIRITLPDGKTVEATGWHMSRKEAERQCAIEACRKLKNANLLRLPEESPAGTAAAAGGSGAAAAPSAVAAAAAVAGGERPWVHNPKNFLNASPLFKDRSLRREPLPVRITAWGPDHNRTFEAQLDLPMSRDAMEQLWVAVGTGNSKAEAERQCCLSACAHLEAIGLLSGNNSTHWSGGRGGGGPVTVIGGQSAKKDTEPQIPWLRLPPEELAYLEQSLDAFDREVFSQPLPSSNASHLGDYLSPYASASAAYASSASADPDLHLLDPNAGPAGGSSRLPPTGNKAGSMAAAAASAAVAAATASYSALNEQLQKAARRRATAPDLAERLRGREKLPAWSERERVLELVRDNKVTLVVGETGCGKTTQVPQFVLEEAELRGKASSVHILVTQPRRIAAISVAERVAWERGEEVGKSVGYSIRLESSPPRPRASIHFMTTGILLRRLQSGLGGVAGVSHIVIDEVHERELDTDFLLVLVREMLATQPDLRIIIMSATVETELFRAYFSGCPVVTIPGNTFPVRVTSLEDMTALPRLPMHSRPVIGRAASAMGVPNAQHDDDMDADLAAGAIAWVDEMFAEDDGAILCFLPSWDAISAVKDRLSRSGRPRLHIITLHSQVPQAEQRAAFAKPPPLHRKVILSTNIAETSVTIDDIVYVVDSGKCKEKVFEPTRNLSTMKVQWISKASATQRQGRAGRCRAGHCFRLYTRQVHESMAANSAPEMQRVALEELCLKIKSLGMAAAKGTARSASSPTLNDDFLAAEAAAASAAGRHVGRLPRPQSVGTLLNAVGAGGGGAAAAAAAAASAADDASFYASVFASVGAFLAKAPTPPAPTAVRAAIAALQQLGAMDAREELTPLGETLGKLAVHPRIGKLLVYASLFRCLDPLLGVAAAAGLTRDVFVSPLLKRDEADAARYCFAVGPAAASDHLTAVAAHFWWRAAWAEGRGVPFTSEHFLSGPALKMMSGLKEQITRMLYDAGVLRPNDPDFRTTDQTTEALYVARCVLVAGLYPNVARSDMIQEGKGGGGAGAGKGKTRMRFGFRTEGGRVFLHPNSVVYRMDSDKLLDQRVVHFIAFNEKVNTSQLFIRGLSVVPALAVTLFGGILQFIPGGLSAQDQQFLHQQAPGQLHHQQQQYGQSTAVGVLAVDSWLAFFCDNHTGGLLLRLRGALDWVLQRWVRGIPRGAAEQALVDCTIRLLSSSGSDLAQGLTRVGARGDAAAGGAAAGMAVQQQQQQQLQTYQ